MTIEILKTQKEELRKKAATTTTTLGDGYLNRVQNNKFIDLTIEYQKVLQDITHRAVDHPKGEIDKIILSGNVLRRQDSEGGTETTTSSPTVTNVEYDTVQLVACFDLTIQADSDSIEKKGFKNTMVRMFSSAISNDLAQLVIEGDDSLGSANAQQNLLRSFDGIHIQTQLCPNILDVNGLGVSLLMYKDLMAALPNKWKKGDYKSRYKFIGGVNVVEDMQYTFAARATAGGDKGWTQDVTLAPFGIPIVQWPFIPEDLTIGTAQTDGTFILLADPKNFILFIQRNIKFYFDFRPRKGLTEVTIYMCADFQIVEQDMIAKARSLSCDASTAYTG